jgi:non-ribosomal peptide synthetase component F
LLYFGFVLFCFFRLHFTNLLLLQLSKLSGQTMKYEKETPVHILFEQKASAHPNDVAVELGDAKMTFSELDRYANAIADLLHIRGVREFDRVGLFVAPSFDMIASILAVLKLGAVYVIPLSVFFFFFFFFFF